MTGQVYLNGAFVPQNAAHVSVYDGGWLHGAGLFETMRAENGRVFRFDAHLDRLMASAQKLLFPVDRPDLPLTRDVNELLDRNGLRLARLRLTVTAGSALEHEPDDRPPITVCLTAGALDGYPDDYYRRGVAAVVAPYVQSTKDPLAGHKVTAHLPRLMALRAAHQVGCAESLWFTPQNLLAEGSISNVFLVRDGTLLTPPLHTPVLPGIARAVVLEIAARDSIAVEEKPLNINDLLDADEAMITNAIMQVMPLCRVEQKTIGSGRPGPITRKLLASYRRLVERECGAPDK